MTLRSIRSLSLQELSALANLHSAVMQTLLADLGKAIVLRYYQIAQDDPRVIGWCAFDESDRLIGWVIGSPDPSALNAGVRRNGLWFSGQMIKLLITRPFVFAQLLRSVFSPAQENDLMQGAIELTYIGVDPSSRGHGIARALIRAFVDAAAQAGYDRIVLSVETDNASAITLYERSGFQITRTFYEGSYHRHRMTLFHSPLSTFHFPLSTFH